MFDYLFFNFQKQIWKTCQSKTQSNVYFGRVESKIMVNGMTTHHMAFKRFLSILTEAIQNSEYHDLIVHRLAGHPFIW